jgi:hypothetical protein
MMRQCEARITAMKPACSLHFVLHCKKVRRYLAACDNAYQHTRGRASSQLHNRLFYR